MKLDPSINLGQAIVALSVALSGFSATAGFVFGTRQDVALLDYRLSANEKADAQRAVAAEEFRREVLEELRGIRSEITNLRIEIQDKEPRKR